MAQQKQKMRERPLSPHLTIYKPQITSVLSITHRMTGAFNLIGAYLFVFWLLSLFSGEEAYNSMTGFLGSFIGLLLLFAWSVSVSYHLFNGIRHLFWDMGKGYELDTAAKSGIAVLVLTVISVLFIWIVA